MKLISEEIVDVQFVTEDANGKKSHFIEGVFLNLTLEIVMVECILSIL